METTTAPDQIQLYLAYCANRGIRPGSLALYRSYLSRVPDLADASREDVQLWLGRHPHWKPATRANALVILQGFYRWLRRSGYRGDDPAEELEPPKVPRGVPRPASLSVVTQALLSSSEREQLMIALGSWAGLRRAEIARVRWSDVIDGILYVDGKGGVGRAVVLAPQLVEMLDAERRRRLAGSYGTGWRTPPDPRSPWVFPRTHGAGPMSPAMIGRRVKAAMDGVFTTHQLRHRYASRLHVHSQHNMMLVKDQMGHASVATTQIYVAIDPTDVLAAVSAVAAESFPAPPEEKVQADGFERSYD